MSGHRNATVRRCNGDSGEYIGEPISFHTKAVCSVAIRINLNVPGSCDYYWYRWNATTGESTVSALQGHGDSKNCVAISDDGKQIVLGS